MIEYYQFSYSIKQAPVPPKSSSEPSVAEMAAVIRRAWLRGEISHKQVKQDLGIHQSQFSKLVNGRFKEPTGNAYKLFEYSSERTGTGRQCLRASESEQLKSELTECLMRAWDGTPEGAKALKAILDGVACLLTGASR